MGGQSDFREIPLIISAFYIRNPLFLVLAALITSIELHNGYAGSFITTFVMHVVPLVITWAFYQYIINHKWPLISKGMSWIFYVFIYYALLLVPIMILMDQYLEINHESFLVSFQTIMFSMKFELVATAFITALYLIQLDNRKRLKDYRTNLEDIVAIRTKELATANNTLLDLNKELQLSSDEIKSMNDNLDQLVKERSKKIEDQLTLLVKYAHMNSHEVRAPLARMLGLIFLIGKEDEEHERNQLLLKIDFCGKELDEVIKKMNRLLEKEIFAPKKRVQ